MDSSRDLTSDFFNGLAGKLSLIFVVSIFIAIYNTIFSYPVQSNSIEQADPFPIPTCYDTGIDTAYVDMP